MNSTHFCSCVAYINVRACFQKLSGEGEFEASPALFGFEDVADRAASNGFGPFGTARLFAGVSASRRCVGAV